jgi:hypothetical protein
MAEEAEIRLAVVPKPLRHVLRRFGGRRMFGRAAQAVACLPQFGLMVGVLLFGGKTEETEDAAQSPSQSFAVFIDRLIWVLGKEKRVANEMGMAELRFHPGIPGVLPVGGKIIGNRSHLSLAFIKR